MIFSRDTRHSLLFVGLFFNSWIYREWLRSDREKESGMTKWSPWECYLIDCLTNKELNSLFLLYMFTIINLNMFTKCTRVSWWRWMVMFCRGDCTVISYVACIPSIQNSPSELQNEHNNPLKSNIRELTWINDCGRRKCGKINTIKNIKVEKRKI